MVPENMPKIVGQRREIQRPASYKLPAAVTISGLTLAVAHNDPRVSSLSTAKICKAGSKDASAGIEMSAR